MNAGDLRDLIGDTWMLSIAPGMPARLPWRAAYACYRRLARSPRMFGDAVAAARIAPDYLPIADVDAFLHDVRTTYLLDVADLQLSRRQSLDWWPSHVAVEGRWPRAGAFIAVTFHYGTGLWLCRALRRSGHRSTFLSARFEREAFARRPLLHRYGMRRLAEVERIGGEPITYRPGARRSMLDTLARGVPVVGLIDVPPRLAARGQHPVRLLGQPASLPDGLLRLAEEAQVPIVPCWVEIDFASGRRRVVIGEATPPGPAEAVLAELAALLDRLVRAQPAAWMFWQEWRDWLRDAVPLHGSGAFSNPDAEGRLADSNPATGPTT
jgi:hypothetical protein